MGVVWVCDKIVKFASVSSDAGGWAGATSNSSISKPANTIVNTRQYHNLFLFLVLLLVLVRLFLTQPLLCFVCQCVDFHLGPSCRTTNKSGKMPIEIESQLSARPSKLRLRAPVPRGESSIGSMWSLVIVVVVLVIPCYKATKQENKQESKLHNRPHLWPISVS